MRLAWEILNGLDAYRITQIPRWPEPARPRRQSADPGLAQRVAALAAAYHAGAGGAGTDGAGTGGQATGAGAVAIGWLRPGADGPVQLLAAGTGLVGSRTEREVLLTLPGGASAQPLAGTLGGLMSVLPCWRAIGGISDGLLTDEDRPSGMPAPSSGLSLEECLLAVWPAPFGWLLLAEPVGGTQAQGLADALARREAEPAGGAEREALRRRLRLRHAELRRGMSTGLWRVRMVAGGGDCNAASRVAGLVCASAGLGGLPYAIAPVPGSAGSLRELLEDPAADAQDGDAILGSPLMASTELVAALARPPGREIPGVRLVSRPDFDVTQEPVAQREVITVGEVLDRSRRRAGRLV